MSHLFPTDRSLLYPQFETYRLRSVDPDADLSSYPLPGSGATQSRVGYNQHHLSFKEVRARIACDHLAAGEGGRGVYVDADWNVIGFQLNEALEPVFTTLASLPVPISGSASSSAGPVPEYPMARQLDPTHWAVSSGSGSLYILVTSPSDAERFTGEFIARYDLAPTGSTSPVPFTIQATRSVSRSESRLLLSRTLPASSAKGKGRAAGPIMPSFELLEVSLDPTARTDTDDTRSSSLQVGWQLPGGDLPYHCSWAGKGWLVLSGEQYGSAADVITEPNQDETTPDEPSSRGRPLPKKGVNKPGLGARGSAAPVSASGAATGTTADEPEETTTESASSRHPYSWTQDSDSLSITVPLPAGTPRDDVQIELKGSGLMLHLRSSPPASHPLAAFLTLPVRQWWSAIDLSLSTFSYNAPRSQLELELTKSDRSVRWPSVFAPSDEEEEDEEVRETLSASTLAAVRESFNRIKTREPDEPEGNHPAIPALLREEMDFDLEDGEDYDAGDAVFGESSGSKTGRDVFVGYIKDGQTAWSKTTTTALALPLRQDQPGVLIKSAVDGVLFAPSSDPTKEPWTHVSTNPALAFVLSSKRDLRTIKFLTTPAPVATEEPAGKKPRLEAQDTKTTVLTFDSGASINTSGNMYSYYPAISKTEARQGVVSVSGGENGPLLGVQLLRVGLKEVVVVLCEKALVVLHSIL